MDNSLARLDPTQILCDIDDCYQVLNHLGEAEPKPPYDPEAKQYRSKLRLSEVASIIIAFHGSGFRTFNDKGLAALPQSIF